ncbi:hypothetical protein FIBSPDRAFT_1039711, partial [Athelia psychrophila]
LLFLSLDYWAGCFIFSSTSLYDLFPNSRVRSAISPRQRSVSRIPTRSCLAYLTRPTSPRPPPCHRRQYQPSCEALQST